MTHQRKKVVHVTFDMMIGGAEQVIYNLMESTDSSAYEVSVLCLDQPVGPFGRQLQEKGYSVRALNRKPGFDMALIRDIRNYVRQYSVDVLHCHQYTPYVYGLFGAAFTPCKVIFTEHGRFYPDYRKLKRVLLNPFLNLFTDYVTAISSATRDALVRFENFPRGKVEIVYNGIRDDKYRLPGDPKLKGAAVVTNPGHMGEAVEDGEELRFQLLVNHTVQFTRDYEVTIDASDNVTFKAI